MPENPINGFEIDSKQLRCIGQDLQRPECILAQPDGTLWSADARGGVVKIGSDGTQKLITQKTSKVTSLSHQMRLKSSPRAPWEYLLHCRIPSSANAK